MLKGFPINWLIVDDDPKDSELVHLAINDIVEGAGQCTIVRNIKETEDALKENYFEIAIVDYFYNDSDYTAQSIIPLIKRYFPFLPIIAMSSSHDNNIVISALNAGAFAFLVKTDNLRLMTKSMVVATSQAIHLSEAGFADSFRAKVGRMYLEKELARQIENASTRKYENNLIVGEKGTGKTEVAKLIASEYLKKNSVDYSKPIISIDCREPSESVSALLFGDERSFMNISAFEAAKNGVLVIENIEYLGKKLMAKLIDIYRKKFAEDHSGKQIPIRASKTVITINPKQKDVGTEALDEIRLYIVDREISLPTLHQLKNGHRNAILKALHNARSDFDCDFSSQFVQKLENIITFSSSISSFQDLADVISICADNCRLENRRIIQDYDIPPRYNISNLQLTSLTNYESGINLLKLLESGTDFSQMKALLRSIAISIAVDKHNGNVKQAAKALGVSQNFVYTQLRVD